jgi:glycosyltransferase involved in cell wall biosynthesis
MDAVALSFGAPKERLVRIPNGVDTHKFKNTSRDQAAALRSSLGLEPSQKILLYVGRLSSEKGLQTLLESALPLLKKDSNLRLCLVGDGPMRPGILEMAKAQGLDSSLIFAGFQEDPGVYYAMADLFVLPSYEEGMSNALLEAMASGLAVVATDVGAAREMLGDGYSLAAPRESESLRGQIQTHLEMLSKGEDAGAQLQKRCEELFSMEAVAARYVSLYRELGKTPRTSAVPSVVQAAGHAIGALWSH